CSKPRGSRPKKSNPTRSSSHLGMSAEQPSYQLRTTTLPTSRTCNAAASCGPSPTPAAYRSAAYSLRRVLRRHA
ncbi:MAG: hypothetical protein ACXVXO_15385, partial [Mycobacteriaceae bacterium]